MAYFHGPWFVTPREVAPQDPPVSFLPQECCLSSIQDSNPLLSVVGKCCVLEPDDYRVSRKTRLRFEIQNTHSTLIGSSLSYFFYQRLRPTEHSERDVYLCDSLYDETKRLVTRKTSSSVLKRYAHSASVRPDEVYHLRVPLRIRRVSLFATRCCCSVAVGFHLQWA